MADADITKTQIARLVLGYLQQQNCKIAVKYFHKHSPHLDLFRQRKSRQIAKRYNNCTLEEILLQYSQLCAIVEMRLEETEYYKSKALYRHDLPEQVSYLLNLQHKSRSTSPISETDSPINEEMPSVSSIEKSQSLDVNATPLQNLPGNSVEGEHRLHSSSSGKKRKTDELEESSSGDDKEKTIENALDAFKESLLADENLQTRIAHAINEVRDHNATAEMDYAIQTILDRTQTDPAFEHLIEDIIGPAKEKEKPMITSTPGPSNAENNIYVVENVVAINNQPNGNTAEVVNGQQQSAQPIFYINAPLRAGMGITEQEIYSMPTFFVQDDNQVIQVPKKQLADYITLYKSDDGSEAAQEAAFQGATISVVHMETVPVQPEQQQQQQQQDTPDAATVRAATPRSNRSSHVRALDFKFQTPAKDIPKVVATDSPLKTKAKSKTKTSKTLFTTQEPWDSKYRNSEPLFSSGPRPAPSLNTSGSPNENLDTNNAEAETVRKKPPPRKAKAKQLAASAAAAAAAASPTKNNRAAKVNETTPATKPKSGKLPAPADDEDKKDESLKLLKKEADDCLRLKNLNSSPKYHNKCNSEPRAEIVISVIHSETLEATVSKRMEPGEPVEEVHHQPTDSIKDMPLVTEDEIIEAPDNSERERVCEGLETPAKEFIPKTPGKTPNLIDTPFMNKLFHEQTAGVDLASIPTPKMMLTPSFPITPFMAGDGFPTVANRPTDYSTSSSYYQPSDTEQNKSLEAEILESFKQKSQQQQQSIEAEAATLQKIKALSLNVIARKDLNLLPKRKEMSTSQMASSDSESEDSSSCSSSSEDEEEEEVTRITTRSMLRSLSADRSGSIDGKKVEEVLKQTEEVIDRELRSNRSRSAESREERKQAKREKTPPPPPEKKTKPKTTKQPRSKAAMKTTAVSTNNKTKSISLGKDCEPANPLQETTPRSTLLNDLEQKRQRMLIALKNDDVKQNSSAGLAKRGHRVKSVPNRVVRGNAPEVAKLPVPEQQKTNAIGRHSRAKSKSVAARLNQLDLELTSEEEEGEYVEPLEIVETELRSSTNTPLHLIDGEKLSPNFPLAAMMAEIDGTEGCKSSELSKQGHKEKKAKVKAQGNVSKTDDVKVSKSDEVKMPKKNEVKVPKKDEEQLKKKESDKKRRDNNKKDDKKSDEKSKSVPKDKEKSKSSKSSKPKTKPAETKIEVKSKPDEKSKPAQKSKEKTSKKPTKPPEEKPKEEQALVKAVKNQPVVEVIRDPRIQVHSAHDSIIITHHSSDSDSRYTPPLLDSKPTNVPETHPQEPPLPNEPEQPQVPESQSVRDKMLDDFKERQIHLIPKQLPQQDLDLDEDTFPLPEKGYRFLGPKDDSTLGNCLKTINTPEEELIFLDVKVFTEPIEMSFDEHYKPKQRNKAEDRDILNKTYSMNVYEEENDREISRMIKATPFISIFEHSSTVDAVKKRVKILENVVVKERPLKNVYAALVSEACDALANSADDTTSPRSSKRKTVSEGVESSVEVKKAKIDDHQRLLKNINVDLVLEQIHG